jgi:hypothetical protein
MAKNIKSFFTLKIQKKKNTLTRTSFEMYSSKGVLFCFILSFLPLFFVLYYLNKENQKLALIKNRVAELKVLCKKWNTNWSKKSAFIHSFQSSNPLFLKTYLEKMQCLQNEIKILQKCLSYPELKQYFGYNQRLAFLLGNTNRCIFQESLERQTKSIEVDAEDLKHLINLIEKNQEEKPQLLIKECHITKKNQDQDTFFVLLEIIKRLPL